MALAVSVFKQLCPDNTFLINKNRSRVWQASLEVQSVFFDDLAAGVGQNRKCYFVAIAELLENVD